MPTLYSIKPSAAANRLDITPLSPPPDLATTFTLLFNFDLEGEHYVAGLDTGSKIFVFYAVSEQSRTVVFEKAQTAPADLAWDSAVPFTLGGIPCLVAYHQTSGLIRFYRIEQNLSLTKLYDYKKTYGDVTSGLTTVVPFSYRYGLYLLAYNGEDGQVNFYQLSVPADEALYMTSIWSSTWAKGWTRFAFFKWGGENFFLKQNPVYDNVNIDHIMSDPRQGSHPVGTHLKLEMDLDRIVTFDTPGDNPYFIAYKSDGTTTFNRFNGGGRDWQLEADETLSANVKQLRPFTLGGRNYLLAYGGK